MKIKYRKIPKHWKYQVLENITMTLETDAPTIRTPFVTLFRSGHLIIHKGYAWDGPSGPAIDTENFMRGSLIHDVLYQLMREGYLDYSYRKYADQLLREICIADGMWPVRAAWVYMAVRVFGGKNAKPKK